jgi:cytochrome c biogenesis protein CcmG, thiol:disulfide interchange protein DsbE
MTTTSNRSRNKRPTSKKSRSRSRRSSRGNSLVWIFLGVLVVLFAIIAFVSRTGGPEITSAEASGQALPTFGTEPDGAVGQPAPPLSGSSTDGSDMTIEPGDGTPKAIVFLAHWCPHCQREVPTVVQWLEGGNLPDGVELVGVTTGIDRNRPNYPPQQWFERENWDVPTLVDGDNAAAQAYGLATYPYWVLVDGDGNVVQRWSGETTAEQLTQRIGGLAPQ